MNRARTLIVGLTLVSWTLADYGQTETNKPAATTPPAAKADADKKPQKWIGLRVGNLMPMLRPHLKNQFKDMPENSGLMVFDVTAESPAVLAGIEKYDLLLRAEGQPLTKSDELQAILDKRNFGATVRLDIVHEGMVKTAYVLVLERPAGESGLNGNGRGGGPGGRRGGFMGGANATLTYTDADGKEQKVSGDQTMDFWKKMREDEAFRNTVRTKGFTVHVAPAPPETATPAANPPAPAAQ